ncbi:MAG: hypothetical protein IJL62_02270 [Clostridia bacterium]|nr:hypothetical protein [Clostridia bacterium]
MKKKSILTEFFAKFLRIFREETSAIGKTDENIEKDVAKIYGNCGKDML